MTLETIDHTEKALSRIIDDLKRDDFEKFVAVYTEEIQELEDALIDLADQKNLDVITGIWLDFLGKLIGEPRSGRTDEPYRSALRVKIAVNTSDGTPNKIISLVRQYTSSENVRLTEGTIAWATLFFNGTENIDQTLHQMVEEIKPAATRWILHSDIDDNSLDAAWEESVSEEVFANVAAECGDFEVECGEPGSECGDSILKPVTFFSVGYYLPSLNENDIFAWEDTQVQINAECGEPEVECGEQGAECGNNLIVTTVDAIRPLRWEVTENSLV